MITKHKTNKILNSVIHRRIRNYALKIQNCPLFKRITDLLRDKSYSGVLSFHGLTIKTYLDYFYNRDDAFDNY